MLDHQTLHVLCIYTMTQSKSDKSDDEIFEALRAGLLAQPTSAKRDESLRMNPLPSPPRGVGGGRTD